MSYSDSDLVGLDADECRIIMKKRAKIELKNLYDIKNTLSNNLFDVSKYNNSYSKIDNEIVGKILLYEYILYNIFSNHSCTIMEVSYDDDDVMIYSGIFINSNSVCYIVMLMKQLNFSVLKNNIRHDLDSSHSMSQIEWIISL